MGLESMYQGTLTGYISVNANAMGGLQMATNADIDKLFTDRGLLHKGDKPAESPTATDADIDKLFSDRGLLRKGAK